MTVHLLCGTAKTLRVAPDLTVDSLLRLATDAFADTADGCWGGDLCGALAGPPLLRCDGWLLHDGRATLAESGVACCSRIELFRAVQGGMPANRCIPACLRIARVQTDSENVPAGSHATLVDLEGVEYQSITRKNMMMLIGEAAALLRRGGFKREVTSHALQGLFQNAKTMEKAFGVAGAPFHPQARWGMLYSKLPAMIVVTYTWAMNLVEDLPAFLDEAERMLRLTEEEKESATWWIDIFFNDQNKKEMSVELEKAKHGYQRARFHTVFLRHGVFARGWCLAELLYRLQVLPQSFRLPHSVPSTHPSDY